MPASSGDLIVASEAMYHAFEQGTVGRPCIVTMGNKQYVIRPNVSSGTPHQSAESQERVAVKAVPAAQQLKATCGTYICNDLGVKGINSGTLSDCWKQ